MTMRNFPSVNQIAQAGDLEFHEADRHSSIEISAEYQGWPVTVRFSGRIEVLPQAIAKLERAGLTPRQQSQAVHKPKRKAVEPLYQPDGTPCCPVHTKPLKQGQYRLYCSAKADGPESRNGYCGLRFTA